MLDLDGIRRSHPSPDRIGLPVSTDPSDALAGREVMEIDEGTLGRSARGKVPLLAADGEIVGAVSVGIAYDSVRDRLLGAIPGLLAYAGGALAAGALAAYLLSRRIQRQTRDLAFSDIAGLLAEREAMLHSIREGVIALDPDGRVRLVNDEAARLLGLAPDAAGGSPGVRWTTYWARAAPPTSCRAASPAGTCSPSRAPGSWSPTGCPPRTAAPSPPCATAPSWSTWAASSTPPGA